MTEFLKHPLALYNHWFFTKNISGSTHRYTTINGLSPVEVACNIKIIENIIGKRIVILNQTHTNKVIINPDPNVVYEADAHITDNENVALAIKTADCVPILIKGSGKIAAIHAGWKGAINNIIENTVNQMNQANLQAVIGPCIRQQSYEVDQNYFNKFIQDDKDNEQFFINSTRDSHFRFDLPGYVKSKLTKAGIDYILDIELDTFSDDNFFSYRYATLNNIKYSQNIISVISL